MHKCKSVSRTIYVHPSIRDGVFSGYENELKTEITAARKFIYFHQKHSTFRIYVNMGNSAVNVAHTIFGMRTAATQCKVLCDLSQNPRITFFGFVSSWHLEPYRFVSFWLKMSSFVTSLKPIRASNFVFQKNKTKNFRPCQNEFRNISWLSHVNTVNHSN